MHKQKENKRSLISFDIISHVNARPSSFVLFLYLCRCSHCPQAFRYNNNVWTLFQWCFCKNDYWQDIVVAVWYSFCPLQLPEKIFFIPLFNTYLSICYLYFFASKVQYAQNIFSKSELILLIIFVLISG